MTQEIQKSYSFGVLTLSDKGSRGERDDTSGVYLKETLVARGYRLVQYQIIPDDKETIIRVLRFFVDELRIDLIVTTGGTGLAPTDVTPEAMTEVLDKEIPGIAEAMRAASMLKTNRAMLSRGKAGIRAESLIVNLPGSLKAVKENMEVILPVLSHALEKIKGDTSDCGSPVV
jgi:molybdopterin adenylyltransferase